MNRGIAVICRVALIGVALSGGCATRTAAPEPAQMLYAEGVTTTLAMETAHDVLADMHFPIEKLDVKQGVIRTRPLRAAQFFEFWRSDNVGAFNTTEANVQSIRRTVELRVSRRAVDHRPQVAGASSLSIECDVQVQRLALPANEIAGISQAYLIHTRSEATLQVLDVTPQQRAGMAWIDLGPDPQLAAEILRRIEQKLQH